jgi:hypothetical protein
MVHRCLDPISSVRPRIRGLHEDSFATDVGQKVCELAGRPRRFERFDLVAPVAECECHEELGVPRKTCGPIGTR